MSFVPRSHVDSVDFRKETVHVAVDVSVIVVTLIFIYAALSWDRPHRLEMAILAACALALAGLVGPLGLDRLVETRWCDAFFMVWSGFDVVVVSAMAWLDGGASSPIALTLALVLVYGGLYYPPRVAIAVGALSVAGYLVLGLQGDLPARSLVFVGGILAVMARLCVRQAGLLDRHRRRQAEIEEELHKSQARVEQAFQDAVVGTALLTLDGRFVRANQAYVNLVGYGEPELLGMTMADLTHPDDIEASREIWSGVAADSLARVTQQKRYVRKDGGIVWVQLNLARAGGDDIFVIGQAEDVTARRQAEHALLEAQRRAYALLDNIQDFLLVVEPVRGPDDGRIVWANGAIERELGYSQGELVGRSWSELVHEEDRAAAVAGSTVPTRYRVVDTAGSAHTVEAVTADLVDNPLVNGLLVSARDVSERVALESERERLEFERRLSQRLEAVGQLAAGIAHEINTPLQFVADSLSFLRDGFQDLQTLDGRYREVLRAESLADRVRSAEEEADLAYLQERIPAAFERVFDGVGRVGALVRAMKEFAHTSQSETAPADLNEGIRTTLTVTHNEVKHVADVDLRLGELPLVTCNAGELNQVFLNLVVNAAHAIADRVAETGGRGTIWITTGVDPSAGAVSIRVADDGGGIPPDIAERLFEPFFTTKEVGRGSGQGLAIARTIVERHGGTIGFRPRAGGGTTFEVSLPLDGAARDSLAA